MSDKKSPYLEEYLYLPALAHDSAIIAWGGFFFEIDEDDGKEEWKLLDDDELRKRLGRRETIGEKSEPYAPRARVEVRQAGGSHSVEVEVQGANHAIVTGLQANTTTEAPGVRVSFSGHEHNFQYARDGAQHHFLTGGGGKYREATPSSNQVAEEMVQAWGGNVEGHFLLVTLDDQDKRMEIMPYGHLGEGKLRPIKLNPSGVSTPFVVE